MIKKEMQKELGLKEVLAYDCGHTKRSHPMQPSDAMIEAVARGFKGLPYPADGEQYTSEAICLIDAYHKALAAEGFAVVPVEPTDAMILAGRNAPKMQGTHLVYDKYLADIYRLMLEAAKGGV